MKILIDGYEANVPQRLGSGQVAFELIKNLERIDKKNEYVVYLPDVPIEGMPKEREGFKYRILKIKKLWTSFSLPLSLFLFKEKGDVFFSPTHYIPRFTKIKRVSMIFDLAFLRFPEMFMMEDLWKLKTGTRYSVENSSSIITISQFSKRDIVKKYAKDVDSQKLRDKITVAYPGYDDENYKVLEKSEVEKVLIKHGIWGDYIIFIGTLQPRKNLERLIEAVANIEGIKLVVVGKGKGLGKEGWMYEEILKAPRKFNIGRRVIFTGFVEKGELVSLLNGAKAFVLPSLWEGFGIPIVEAMACGVPVIVSNVSSLPEVVGRAGLLVDPASSSQIEQAIRSVLADKKLGTKLSKSGLEQAKKFSWRKMAKETLKALENV